MSTITFKGAPIEVQGQFPATGKPASAFTLTAGDLSDKGLADFRGKGKILNIVPSLDTPVCAISARRFNEEVGTCPGVVLLNISADLPFAQKRFCEGGNLSHVVPLSTFRSPSFAKDYGVLIASGALRGLTARAVVVLDAKDTVVHAQLVADIAQEPDYAAALKALS